MDCIHCGTDDERHFENDDVCVACEETMADEVRQIWLEEEFSPEELGV